MPRAVSELATANGMAPPPAINPTGEEISHEVMVRAAPCSVSLVRIGGQAQRAVFSLADEGEDLGNRRIRACERLHRAQSLSKNTRSKKQFLIERAYRGKPLAGEIASPHADNIESFKAGVLTVDKAERNDVVANAANAANHYL